MKKVLLIVYIFLNFQFGFCQQACGVFDFENPYHSNCGFFPDPETWLDTNSLVNQVWQIGQPQKVIFDSSYTLPNSIVTKLDTSYPPNDTSSFIFRELITSQLSAGYFAFFVEGYFKINSDTISDYGYIEFSPNNGISWHKLSPMISYPNGSNKIDSIFTGNTNGWAYFGSFVGGYNYNIQSGDTVAYRFTFISDSVQTNKEGWILDNIGFDFIGESVPEIENANLINISPNPTNNNLIINRNPTNTKEIIQVFNYTGQIVLENSNFKGRYIDTRQLQNGFYLLKYSNNKSYCIKKFIVQH
jgi:hypothetical protein